ncbi:MAG TPA: Ig-like domain-containing protein [Pseudothermotoga sp.]|nr:Ig-like domain-containing protein [Pseudothermotoga sp.]
MKPLKAFLMASFALILFFAACGGPSVATNKAPRFVSAVPANEATDVATDTKLEWTFTDPENDTLTYELMIGENKSKLQTSYKGTINSFAPKLEPSKTYFWKVIADDGHGNKVDSGLLTFSTVKINRPPEKPELISPTPSSENVDYERVTFQWRCVDPDQDPLRFEVYVNSSFLATTTNYQYMKNNLTPGEMCSWYVKAFDGQYWVQSDPATFVTAQEYENKAPYVPQLISPPDGAESVNIPVTLQWNCSDPDGDSLTYDVYLNDMKKTTTTLNNYVLNDLSPNTTYNWYVKVSDGSATTQGPVWSFTTKGIPNRPPEVPSNPSPKDKSTISGNEVTLSWQSSDPDGDALFYDLYFGETSNPPMIRQNLQSTTMLIQNLEVNKKYYWKVVAKDGNASIEGPVWSFYTGAPSSFSRLLSLAKDGVYSVDFTKSPVEVTRISTVTGNDLFYHEQTIFVIGEELSILSDSNVATASFYGNNIWVSTLEPVQKIVAGEVFACVTNDASLLILRATDQWAVLESSVELNQPSSLFVYGQYIYVCDSTGLRKLDLSDPSYPVQIKLYSSVAKDVFVVDNVCYLLTDSKIITLNSDDLSEVRSIDFQDGSKIYFDSGFVYVLGGGKLVKFDEDLSQLKQIDITGKSVLVSGNYVYVAVENGIKVFDSNLDEVTSKSVTLQDTVEVFLIK